MAALFDQPDENRTVVRPRSDDGGEGPDNLCGWHGRGRTIESHETYYSKVAEDGRGGLECREVEAQCLAGTTTSYLKITNCRYMPPPPKPAPARSVGRRPHSPPLVAGSVGSTVKELQILLNRQMNPSPNLKVDGILGDDTLKAVKRFNHEHKIRPEEVVSKQTWDALRMPQDQVLSSNQPYQPPLWGEFSGGGPKASFDWLPPGWDAQKMERWWQVWQSGASLEAWRELQHFKPEHITSFAEMDGSDKAAYVMNKTFDSLWPELKKQGIDAWEHKAELAQLFLLGIAAHSNPVTAVLFDLALLGPMAESIGQDLGAALDRIAHAKSKQDLDEGARLLAKVLTTVAVQVLLHFVAKGASKVPKVVAALRNLSAARRVQAAGAARSSAFQDWSAKGIAAQEALKRDPGATKPFTKGLQRDLQEAEQKLQETNREYLKAEAEQAASDAETRRQAAQLLKEPVDVTNDIEQAATDAGMKPEHLKSMIEYCRQHQRLRIMRFSNPASAKYYNEPGYVPKGVDVKLTTAKQGPNAGLVEIPKNPTSDQLKNIEELRKKGYKFDDPPILRDPKGNKIHADYDTQGEYEVVGRDKAGNAIYRQVDTNEPNWKNQSNARITPERGMTQHGAQDNFVVPDQNGRLKMGRSPRADEEFLAVGPDGRIERIGNPESLQEFIYEQNNIPYPYVEPPPAGPKAPPLPPTVPVPPGKDKKDEPATK